MVSMASGAQAGQEPEQAQGKPEESKTDRLVAQVEAVCAATMLSALAGIENPMRQTLVEFYKKVICVNEDPYTAVEEMAKITEACILATAQIVRKAYSGKK